MSFMGIRPGDRVTFSTPQHERRTGRAQLLLVFESHVVVNLGGRYGTPQVVDSSNYISHVREPFDPMVVAS